MWYFHSNKSVKYVEDVSVRCGWHWRSYAVCVQQIFSKILLCWHRGDELLNKVIIFVLFAYKKYPCSFIQLRLNPWCHMDYFTDVLSMFLDLDHVRTLAILEGLRAVRFHQKYLNLCSEDERRSYRFGTTWGWVINGRIFFFLGELTL